MKVVLLLDYKSQNLEKIIKEILTPIIALLTGFDKLQILLYPAMNENIKEQQQKELRFRAMLERWRRKLGLKWEVDVSCDVKGLPQGPCHIWFKNIRSAFRDPDVDRIIYLPYDITFMVPRAIPGKTDKRLQGFINRAIQDDIGVLFGSYECSTDVSRSVDNNFLIDKSKLSGGRRKDIAKNFLEDFTVLELERNFPNCMVWFNQQREDVCHKPKPRTGFFSFNRHFYEQFVKDRRMMKPWAGTVQLLLCAAMRTREGKNQFKLFEQFVAELEESPTFFGGYGPAHQRLRIEFVIADEREYWVRALPDIPT